ncbi:putative bifunctional diguanylate cyclase/phosphodiesterase [Polymorphum gilvum]|nr:bifunctional diguanylate cyclase/phosphodiesterase [Polymorphum gilvum]
MNTKKTSTGGKIADAIIIPVTGIVVFAILFVFALMLWSSRLTDRTAEQSERNLIEGAIHLKLDQIAKQQEDAAVWDEAYFRTIPTAQDPDWLKRNVAEWLDQSYGHTKSFILGPDRTVIARHDRSGATDWLDQSVLSDLRMPLARVRARFITSFTRTASGIFRFQPVFNDYNQSIFETGAVLIDGSPYFFSATAISPDLHTIGIQRHPPAVLVSFVPIDRQILHRLAEMAGLSGLHPSRQHDDALDLSTIILKSPNRQPVVTLSWQSSKPGSDMLSRVLPVLVLLALAIGTLTALVMGYARSATRKLAASEAKAVHAAQHDSLSGLPNRVYFTRMLSRSLADWKEQGGLIAAVYIDLDHFKDINDTLGHAAGDEVIRAVALRLRGVVPANGMLARISGDEFALILRDCASRKLIECQLDRIQDELVRPVKVSGTELYVSMSMGAAVAPQDGLGSGELLRKADIALYDAKANGRGRWSFFDPVMEEDVRTRDNIARELRHAIDTNALSVAYQPQVDGITGRYVAVETLVRWAHPERGPINPASFVPIAEETGLINDLGLWVLRRACQDAHRWPDVAISVNISPTQFRHPRFVDHVIATLAAYDLPPSRLEIEVTESVFAGKDSVILTAMRQLKELGVRIALDDFGSGYSSLSYLRRFPFDILKIDRDFVSNVGECEQARAILRTIVDLGSALGMTVVAEGIETAEQERFLMAIGCDRLQGYYIARPGSGEEIEPIILGRGLDVPTSLGSRLAS